MYNYSFLLNKKLTMIYLLSLSLSFPLNSFAQSRIRKTSTSSSRTTSKNIRSSNTNTATATSTSSSISNSDVSKSTIDTSSINKYNCENFYTKCMDQFCFNNSNGRCNCKDVNNFNNANSNCNYILQACPSISDDIISSFKRYASNDCIDYNLSQNSSDNKNINNYLASTLACLSPKCSENFVDCFDQDNFDVRFEACKFSYADLDDTTELKELIQKSFNSYKEKFCNDMFGTFKDGTCYLSIGIGVASGDIKSIKEFEIGDKIICSSDFFNTSLGEKNEEKLKSIKNLTLTGISLLQQGLSIAGTAVQSKYEVGKKITSDTDYVLDTNGNKSYITYIEGTGKTKMGTAGKQAISLGVLNSLNSALGGVEDVYNLANKDYSYSGKCFVIKNNIPHELFPEDETVAYKLRWAENWKDEIYAN